MFLKSCVQGGDERKCVEYSITAGFGGKIGKREIILTDEHIFNGVGKLQPK